MPDQTIPPMPTRPPTAGAEPAWWHALYAPDPVAEPMAEPAPAKPRRWSGWGPDWRRGETADLTPSEPEVPEESAESAEEEQVKQQPREEVPQDDQPQGQPGTTRPRRQAPALTRPRLPGLKCRRQWGWYNAAAAGLGWCPVPGAWPGLGEWGYSAIQYYGHANFNIGLVTGGVLIALALPLDLRGYPHRAAGPDGTHPLYYLSAWTARVPTASFTLSLLLYSGMNT